MYKYSRLIAIFLALIVFSSLYIFWLLSSSYYNQSVLHSFVSQKHNCASSGNITSTFIRPQHDVLVFLHIQKTGGTFIEKQLLQLNNVTQCICKRKRFCSCPQTNDSIWLFQRYTVGWACGVHPDWTELHDCVSDIIEQREKRPRAKKLHYFTFLRNPYDRFISEWLHVHRGATWNTAALRCNNRTPSLQEWPLCFQGLSWQDVSLQEFSSCPHNLGINRQTRMLANLSLVNCYNVQSMSSQRRDAVLLESAQQNLQQLDYFGLLEYLLYSQYLFHRSFSLTFREIWVELNTTHSGSSAISTLLGSQQRKDIISLNALDQELYAFAKHLFFSRLRLHLVLEPQLPVVLKRSLTYPNRQACEYLEHQRSHVESFIQSMLLLDGSQSITHWEAAQRNWKSHNKVQQQLDDILNNP